MHVCTIHYPNMLICFSYALKNPPFTVGSFISILGYGVPAPLPVSEPVPAIGSTILGSVIP